MQTIFVTALLVLLAVFLNSAIAQSDNTVEYDDFEDTVNKRAQYAGPFVRFGKRSMQRTLRNSPIMDPLIRFGKRADGMESKRPSHSPLIRFGKRAAFRSAPHIRFGKRSDEDAVFEY
ncbi:unnamed protein product [Bursaphelenchus okinawaensis]|uniref:Uncharacterized protein n=1 Tax=Bursaphelenchus okinawaensis TaxID=465554 RepID=A0A811L143_9BILA|nr:unnamed protein product [Bursaphelenchus okinawaensis]CAG9115618.1 unnamed protein product [Bursaphelenchus okinawaensis]